MKTFLSISFILFFSFNSVSISQVYYGFDEHYELSTFWDFYGNNYLSGPSAGKGNTGAATLNAGISALSINPATFIVNKRFEFCLQYIYKFDLTFPGYGSYPPDIYQNAPPSVSFITGYKPVHNIQIGFFYSNPTSLKNISGFSDELTRVITIQTVGVPFNLLTKKLNIGLSLEYSFYNSTITGLRQETNPNGTYVKAQQFNFRFGLLYKPFSDFSIGASVTPPVELNAKSTLPHIGDEVPPPPRFPLIVNTGIEYRLSMIPLKIAVDYDFTKNVSETHLDINNVNIGAEYSLNKKINLRAGFFTLSNADYNNASGQNYITLGCGLKLADFNIDAAVLHSHFLDGKESNNIIQSSVSYGF